MSGAIRKQGNCFFNFFSKNLKFNFITFSSLYNGAILYKLLRLEKGYHIFVTFCYCSSANIAKYRFYDDKNL